MIQLRGTNDMSDCKHGEYKQQKGTWTLTAPDGRQWQAESGLLAAAKEQNERIPPEVRLARILEPLEPDEGEEAVDDTARLDWLEKHGWATEKECFDFVNRWITPDGKRHPEGLRAAIDALMITTGS